MVESKQMVKVRRGLGLGCALALLSACGPSKPPTDGTTTTNGDAGTDESTNTGDGDTETQTETQTEPPEAMCTVENYADHPNLGDVTEVACFSAGADGTCSSCDLACAESIVTECPWGGCGLPDLPCIEECYDHQVLCSEQLGDQCCHLVTAWGSGAIPGRPLREHGVPLLPSVMIGESTGAEPSLASPAQAYRELARYEQGSVDAFLHAAVILDELWAPAELVADNLEAAREEAGHARLALRAAEALDGREARLGEVPSPRASLDLHAFVRDLILDGCIGEAAAAREAEWALARAGVVERGALTAFWRRVSVEEAGHASLAWRTLEWLLTTRPDLGQTAQVALREAVMNPRSLSPAAEREAELGEAGALERVGLASSRTKAAIRGSVIAELVAEAQLRVSAPAARC